MLAELVDHVIGIDPDRDWITAAVIDAHTTGVIATERFGANSAGYDEAISWPKNSPPPVNAPGQSRAQPATTAVSPLRSHEPASG